MKSGPIYLCAIPRGGGTLLATILDAHPQVAMSYEIYEGLLVGDAGNPLDIDGVLQDLARVEGTDLDGIKRIKRLSACNLQTFLFRARRGGLDLGEIRQEMEDYRDGGNDLTTIEGRLGFIDRLMMLKARKQGKSIWGGKTDADPRDLHQLHPDAIFFIMNRDVRDVYASMRHTGDFKYNAEEAAKLWCRKILDFREFVRHNRTKAMEISYEQLVRSPEKILRRACELIGIDYTNELLTYHEQELTLFQNPHGHLSAEQIKLGLHTESVGRWERDLDADEVGRLMAVAGDLMHDQS